MLRLPPTALMLTKRDVDMLKKRQLQEKTGSAGEAAPAAAADEAGDSHASPLFLPGQTDAERVAAEAQQRAVQRRATIADRIGLS